MAATNSSPLLGHIRKLAAVRDIRQLRDPELLERFISQGDEQAFACLVQRYQSLVLRVCQGVLRHSQDAEDVFQATFLVLARKARSIRKQASVGSWLYGVAYRLSCKARAQAARRSSGAGPEPSAHTRGPLDELTARELQEIVLEEFHRLPQRYRAPLLLCYWEGKTYDEIAAALQWKKGTVKDTLERARRLLRGRLSRRDVGLSALFPLALLARQSTVVASTTLLHATVRAALSSVGGTTASTAILSRRVLDLAEAALRMMSLHRLKNGMIFSLVLSAFFGGSSWSLWHWLGQPPPVGQPAWSAQTGPGLRGPDALNDPVPGPQTASAALVRNQSKLLDEANVPIEVSGRVFDPSGRPYAGAKLYVGYSIRGSAPNFQAQRSAYRPRATSGADGQFHLVFTTSELDARSLDNSRPAVIAVADRYGPDWAQIREPEKRAELSLKLVEDLPLNGRILDQNRQPVAGARVFVLDVGNDSEKGVKKSSQANNGRWRGPLPEQPSSVMTDADGRFRLAGLGRDRIASLSLDGPAIAHSSLTAVTRVSAAMPNAQPVNGATFEFQAAPSQPLRGVVRDKATGKPVAGVRMCAFQSHPPTFTDENGRFEIRGCPKLPEGYAVMAQPQTTQPYFAAKMSVPDRPGLEPMEVVVDLVSGIPVSGRVIDRATGKPPRAGTVEYYPLFPNRHSAKLTHCPALAAASSVIQPDGSYSLVALPGPGVVCVAASPRNSYAVAVVDDKEVADFFHDQVARVNLAVNKYSALSLINPDEKAESLALDLTLQPGRTLQGTLVGPGGEALTGVEVVGLTALWEEEMLESKSFTVTGLNPRCSRELVFRHRGKRLGKLLTIRGDETGPLMVQLEPWGNVFGRVVDKEGKPVPGVSVYFSRRGQSPEITATTDHDGRFRGQLLAGQEYSLSRRLPKDLGAVEVEPGRSIDLGDLAVGD